MMQLKKQRTNTTQNNDNRQIKDLTVRWNLMSEGENNRCMTRETVRIDKNVPGVLGIMPKNEYITRTQMESPMEDATIDATGHDRQKPEADDNNTPHPPTTLPEAQDMDIGGELPDGLISRLSSVPNTEWINGVIGKAENGNQYPEESGWIERGKMRERKEPWPSKTPQGPK